MSITVTPLAAIGLLRPKELTNAAMAGAKELPIAVDTHNLHRYSYRPSREKAI